jgi:hypothetical protein
MADRCGAVLVSAGAPTDAHAAAENLRNTPFSVTVGARDDAYGRRERCLAFAREVEAARRPDDEPGAFPFTLDVVAGHGHGVPDRDELRELLPAVRNPVPRHVTWRMTDEVETSFAWLHVPAPRVDATVEAVLGDNRVDVTTHDVDELHVYLDERMIDYTRPVTIAADGREETYELAPSLRVLCDTMAERGDPRLAFTSRVVLDLADMGD